MKLYELIYLLNKHQKVSLFKYPTSAPYIINAYSNVIKKLTNKYDKNQNITNSNLQDINLTDHMKNKLQFLLTQKIKTEELNNIKRQMIKNELIEVIGVGKIKAERLIKSGLTSINDLKKKKYKEQLTDATILLLKYRPNRRIPHNEIKKIKKKLTDFPNTKLVGSFRRKKPFSRDIDVMVISNKTDILGDYLVYLSKKFKKVFIYAKGSDKVSLLVLVKENAGKKDEYYKIDVFRSPIANQYAMLLYSTGSREFNIKMRAIASKLGYLLNQNGLYKKENFKKESNIIPVSSEKDFFKILNMSYVEPHNR